MKTHHKRSNSAPACTFRAPAFLGALILVLFGMACSAPSVRPYVLGNRFELDADIATSVGPLSTENSADSLGLGDAETVGVFRVDLDWDPLIVSLEGFQVESSGTGVAEATLDLGGPVIAIGEPVDSESDLGLYQVRFIWDFARDPLLDLGLGLGVGYLDYELTIRSLTGPGRISGSDDLPFVFLAARAAKTIGDFEALVLIGGGAIEIGDENYEYIDFEVMVSGWAWKTERATTEVVVGYRYLNYKYEFDADGGEIDIDATLDGPFVGLSFQF